MNVLRLKRVLITRKDKVKQHYFVLRAAFKKRKKRKRKKQLYRYTDLRFYRRVRTDKKEGRRKTGAENVQAEFPDFVTDISPKQLKKKLGKKVSRLLNKYRRFKTKDSLNIGFGTVRKVRHARKDKAKFQLTLFDYAQRKIVKRKSGVL